MPRLLAVGHVTWDRREGGRRARAAPSPTRALAARKLGWEAGDPHLGRPRLRSRARPARGRGLPPAAPPPRPVSRTCYDAHGNAPAGRSLPAPTTSSCSTCPTSGATRMRSCSGPVAGELVRLPGLRVRGRRCGRHRPGLAARRRPRTATSPPANGRPPPRDLAGVHVLFLSEHDLPGGAARAREFLLAGAHRGPHPRVGGPHPLHARRSPATFRRCRGQRSTRPGRATSSRPRSSCATTRSAIPWRPPPSRPAPRPAWSEGIGHLDPRRPRGGRCGAWSMRERLLEEGEWDE